MNSLGKRRPKVPKWVVPVVGLLVSGLSLYFSFRKFDYTQFGHDVRTLIWAWVILAIAAELVSYVIDSWRWLVILSPAEQPTLLQCVQATFIGVLGNDVLLLKAGELIRPFLLTRWACVPFSLSMTAAVVERIMDGIVMVTLFYVVTADISNTPTWMRDGMFVLGIFIAVIAALILFVLFYRSHAHRIVSGRSWTAKFPACSGRDPHAGQLAHPGPGFWDELPPISCSNSWRCCAWDVRGISISDCENRRSCS